MANIIDALVVTLGLDDSNYKKGQATAKKSMSDTSNEATKRAKEMELRGQQAAKFFSAMKVEAISLLAVLTAGAGLKSFISDSIASSAAVGHLAKNINETTEATSAWQNAAARSGGTVDAMAATLRNVSGELTKFKMGLSSDFVAWFARAGGDFSKLKDVNGTMIEMSRIISDLDKKDPGKALMVAKNLGVDEATFNFLRQGPAYVLAQLEAQKKLGVVTDEDAKRAQVLQARIEGMRQASEKLGRDLLTKAIPAIEFMIEKITELGQWAQQHGPAVAGFFTAIAVAIAIPLAETLLLVAAFAAVAAAIGYVYEEWDKWMTGGESSLAGFFQFFSDTWKAINSVFSGTFDAMGRFFKAWLGGVVASFKLFYALLFGSSEEIQKAWQEALGAVGEYWDSIVNLLANSGPAILKGIKAGLSSAFDWAKGRVDAIWAAITGKKATPQAEAPKTQPAGATQAPAASTTAAARTGPRGVRNNNPGNLNFAGQAGATKEGGAGGRFAVFESMEQGIVALVRQLKLYQGRGIDTIAEIVKKYAPGSENDVPAYIKALTSATGLGADDKVNLDDMKTLIPLLKGIISHENGKGFVTDDQIAAGARMASATNARSVNSTSTAEVKISTMNINTQATDAAGIARDAGQAFRQYPMIAPQSNSGMF